MARDARTIEPGVLTRPRVVGLLRAAARRRVTLVVAGGGFGKTTALRDVLSSSVSGGGGWLALRQADRAVEILAARIAAALGIVAPAGLSVRGGAMGAEDRRALAEGQAGLLCEAVERGGRRRTLVVDDLEQLGDDDSGTELLRALCLQAPPGLHLVLCGRRLPALGLGRLRGRGEVVEIAAGDLAFTPDETAALLTTRLGPDAAALAVRCCAITAGWAAALQLTLDRLERLTPDRRPAALEQWERHRGAGWRDFAAELVAAEPAPTRRVLAVAAVTGMVDTRLARGLGLEVSDDDTDELQDRGLLVPVGGAAGNAGEGRVVSPVLAALALSNKADALMHTGRLDEARAAIDAAIESYARLGSLRECIPRGLLGTLYLERGDLVRARVCLEQAVRLAERTQDVHARVTALTALVAIRAAEDPAQARRLATTATELASSLELPRALCAGAYVELHAGDGPAAVALAGRAEAEARRTHDRAALAEALELAGAAADPPDLRLLLDAVAVWEVVGNPVALSRLPPTRRALLAALFADDRKPYAQIAVELGLPVGSLGPTRARVLDTLRRSLTASGIAA